MLDKEGKNEEASKMVNTTTTTIILPQTKVNIMLSEGPISTILCVLAAEIHMLFYQ